MTSLLVGTAVALALTACGGGAHPTPTAKAVAAHVTPYSAPPVSPTTAAVTTTAPSSPTDAVRLATALGCVKPVSDTSGNTTPPKPTGDVTCSPVGGTTAIEVQTYSPKDVATIHSPSYRKLGCSLIRGFGITGPVYEVVGSDFYASVSLGGFTAPPNYKAESQALANALHLPLSDYCRT